MKVLPFEEGTPTVLAQVGEAVYGTGAVGEVLSLSLQAATMLILVLAANTGFADFPRLASFQAGDSFLPRQLTKRGHRLVFSNGIIALAGTAAILVVVTNAAVTRLIPLYAIGVFVGFTLSQAGMTKHHLRLKEPGWKIEPRHQRRRCRDLRCSSSSIVFITRFDDAWTMLIVMPLFVFMLLRAEPAVRARGDDARARRARRRHRADPPSPRRAGVRRPARHGLRPSDPVRPHAHARRAARRALRARRGASPPSWPTSGRAPGSSACRWRSWTAPTDGCIRAAVECVVRELADGETEVSVLLPDRKYRGIWHRVLHDKTADAILEQLSRLPHANVTVGAVPPRLARRRSGCRCRPSSPVAPGPTGEGRGVEQPVTGHRTTPEPTSSSSVPGCIPIADASWRDAGEGRRSRPVRPGGAAARRAHGGAGAGGRHAPRSRCCSSAGARSPASGVGTRMAVEGMVGIHKTRLAILNPSYQLLG